MDECARGPACWARDSRCSAHQEHSRHEQVHGIEQTLRSSTAATAGRRSPAPPPAFVVATVDAPLPREAVARSRAPTGPRAQETAIGGRASERGQAGAAPRSCGRDSRRTFYKPRYSLLFNVILLVTVPPAVTPRRGGGKEGRRGGWEMVWGDGGRRVWLREGSC